jgi:DNA-directed RNA polymerase specialized sigma24 family protein
MLSRSVDLGAAADEPGSLADRSTDELRLRQVLVARYGWDLGMEAWHDAMAYSWEHQAELAEMTSPTGYLFRVAQTSVRRQLRWQRRVDLPQPTPGVLPDIEPGLPAALSKLSRRQRVAVVLVHAHGWTHDEAAEVLGVSVSTLRNHLRRGLERLRAELGVNDDEA